jgi:hypothetical protein
MASPVSLPTASLSAPLACLTAPMIRFLSMLGLRCLELFEKSSRRLFPMSAMGFAYEAARAASKIELPTVSKIAVNYFAAEAGELARYPAFSASPRQA